MSDLRGVFGKNVKRYREAIGMTQKELGDSAGYKQAYISRIENGEVGPSTDSLQKLASALSVETHDLIRSDVDVNRIPKDFTQRLPELKVELENLQTKRNLLELKFLESDASSLNEILDARNSLQQRMSKVEQAIRHILDHENSQDMLKRIEKEKQEFQDFVESHKIDLRQLKPNVRSLVKRIISMNESQVESFLKTLDAAPPNSISGRKTSR